MWQLYISASTLPELLRKLDAARLALRAGRRLPRAFASPPTRAARVQIHFWGATATELISATDALRHGLWAIVGRQALAEMLGMVIVAGQDGRVGIGLADTVKGPA